MTMTKDKMQFIGSAKISQNLRVTLIEEVAAVLKAEEGGKVIYYLNGDGEVIIRAAKRIEGLIREVPGQGGGGGRAGEGY